MKDHYEGKRREIQAKLRKVDADLSRFEEERATELY